MNEQNQNKENLIEKMQQFLQLEEDILNAIDSELSDNPKMEEEFENYFGKVKTHIRATMK